MPGFLRHIFKPSPTPSPQLDIDSQTSQETILDLLTNHRHQSSDPDQDLNALAQTLTDKLQEQQDNDDRADRRGAPSQFWNSLRGSRSRRDVRARDGDGTKARLVDILREIQQRTEEERVTPFRDARSGSGSGSGSRVGSRFGSGLRDRSRSLLRRRSEGNPRAEVALSELEKRSNTAKEWGRAVNKCIAAINVAEKLLAMQHGQSGRPFQDLTRMIELLEAQRDELMDLRAYAEGRRVPTLSTLREIYQKIASGLEEAEGYDEMDLADTLDTLMQVLAEGPDYLIDVAIIEAIIWQAEIIDSSFAADVRKVLDRAVVEQDNLSSFRKAAEDIVAIASALPGEELDDEIATEAYKAIGLLVKQLQLRVSAILKPSPPATPSGMTTPVGSSGMASPLMSPSTPGSIVSASDPDFQKMNMDDLQQQYGTGLPGLSSTKPSAAPPAPSAAADASPTPAPASPTGSEGSVWEYRGHLLTRSALELVLNQEALAGADSSGQYAGDMSWDDLRNAWIPKWVRKLEKRGVAAEEIAGLNPVNFRERGRDQWFNKVGWRDGQMYYPEEPSFELREDGVTG